ncbi:uncharacterized protein A1O9_13001 [Exophiala aquamarina CBS 119918]|uniref:Zn(2)-C6 fungal-type domain-containing protein n=1 Tax=Exophiala aquamarina CBS 119918 TaxID=1182545 RepID=A0A072NSU9_9EURO|nr:uncharacterized protein A1O9_13001 [Exophiala aquamarina CBS 119918]KEF50939.1 hypothetical protein A1O9_13001 [Exophiala aquamarina CBS 119918]
MPSQPPTQPGLYGPPSAGPPPSTPCYYVEVDGGQRRKPVRAAQACDSCRQRKAKCDEGRPECQHCKENGLKCSYREIPPQKSEKLALAITAQLDAITDSVKLLTDNSRAQAQKIDSIRNALSRLRPDAVAVPESGSPEDRKEGVVRTPKRNSSNHTTPFRREDSSDMRAASHVAARSANSPRNGDPETYELSLPAKHTTAAQYLLLWPSIAALVPPGISTSYVMDEERQRGLLRLYGCGEGEDKGDGHEGAPSPSGSSSSDGRRLGEERTPSSHGVWGVGQLHAARWSDQSHPAREHPGGVSPYGGLMLDSDAVDRYFRSFMDHIHILHPFLEPKVLRRMIHTFKRNYSWDYRATQPASVVGAKRKRETTESPSSVDDQNTPDHLGNHTIPIAYNPGVGLPLIEHSITNAIVLLVIALGKVTAHRDPLPGPAATRAMQTATPHNTTYSDLPMPMPTSAPTSPFNNQRNLNRHNHMYASSPTNPQGKNMDIIPGLAYFAKASDIIGEHPGGSEVSHVQAYLLAGLYMGQLARIIPSYFYIQRACMAAQILIESTPYTSKSMKPARRNLVNFAFWSCLQLESDIAAEVELPLSGITRYESSQHKDMPTLLTLDRIPECNMDHDILRYYSYQIQLRLTMNSIHATLYHSQKSQNTRPSDTMMLALGENLEDWRKMLNEWDWDDGDHESPNINIARMRGKYYGAKYIIWRPALQYALLQTAPGKRDPISEPSSGNGESSEFTSPAMRDAHIPNRPSQELPTISSQLLEGSQVCVEAAIRSTTVFDKVPRRLVTTNIFGTVHA